MGTMTATMTRTWELCGTLKVAEPDPEYIVRQDEQGNVITNCTEHVDDQLYGALGHLGGAVAPTAEIDEARRELWAAWDRSDAP